MSAPAKATAGVAFRLPATTGLLDEEANRAASLKWWEAHVDLLRRLLAAQPCAGYPNHGAHLSALKSGEAWVRHFSGGPSLDLWSWHATRQDLEEVLADFGPRDHEFGQHPDQPEMRGWWPRVNDGPWTGLSGAQVAHQMWLHKRVAELVGQEAELPPLVEGTPAIPPPLPAETPAKRLARLKRQLVPLAAVYYDTLPAQLPEDVINVLVEIAELSGGDMAQAITAWQDARTAVAEE